MPTFVGPPANEHDVEIARDCRRIVGISALIVLVGIPFVVYGSSGVSDEETERRRQAAEQYRAGAEERAAVRRRALKSAEQAVIEARAGNCTLAVDRDVVIQELDVEIHANVFRRDPAVQRCLYEATPAAKERRARERRDQAFALLKTATDAARAGNCAAAIELGTKIRAVDVSVHDAWFVQDPAIKVCAAPTRPADTPAPSP